MCEPNPYKKRCCFDHPKLVRSNNNINQKVYRDNCNFRSVPEGENNIKEIFFLFINEVLNKSEI